MNKPQKPRRLSPCTFESLESRQFLSASASAIKPDVSIATTTSLFVSNRAPLLGQAITVKGVVSATSGTAKGTVELLDGNKDTGLTGTLNHLGYFVFKLDAGQAPYVGSHLYRIRYLSAGSFVGSKSRQLIAKVKGPALTTESDGLELTSVTAGTGAVPKANQTVTVQYTGFNLTTGGGVFDDSAAHNPGTFSFILNDSSGEQVIPGFDQEVTGMKVGETRVAIIPEALAYATGSQSSLAGDTLVFIVHLVSIS